MSKIRFLVIFIIIAMDGLNAAPTPDDVDPCKVGRRSVSIYGAQILENGTVLINPDYNPSYDRAFAMFNDYTSYMKFDGRGFEVFRQIANEQKKDWFSVVLNFKHKQLSGGSFPNDRANLPPDMRNIIDGLQVHFLDGVILVELDAPAAARLTNLDYVKEIEFLPYQVGDSNAPRLKDPNGL